MTSAPSRSASSSSSLRAAFEQDRHDPRAQHAERRAVGAEDERAGIDRDRDRQRARAAEQEERHDRDRPVAALDEPAEEPEPDDDRELRRGAVVDAATR